MRLKLPMNYIYAGLFLVGLSCVTYVTWGAFMPKYQLIRRDEFDERNLIDSRREFQHPSETNNVVLTRYNTK